MSGINFESGKYLHRSNNYILPRIIISIASEDFNQNEPSISYYGYTDIVIKSKSGVNKNSMSENAKTVLGLICHEMLLKKSFVFELNYFDIMRSLKWDEETVITHKNDSFKKLKSIIEEIIDFSIDFKYKGANIIVSSLLSGVAFATDEADKYDFIDKNSVRFYINEAFLNLFKHDSFYLAGDSSKINSEKGENSNKLFKILATNNFIPFKKNEIYLSSLFYTLQLKGSNFKNKKDSLRILLNNLVSSGKLKEYEFGKKGFEKTLIFTLNKYDITGGVKKTTLNAQKKDDVYSVEEEYISVDNEPENTQIVNDRSDELPEGHEKIFTNSFDVEEEVEDEFPF